MKDSANGLVCFTNCSLVQEDGSLLQSDLWIDNRRGVIVDAQVRLSLFLGSGIAPFYIHTECLLSSQRTPHIRHRSWWKHSEVCLMHHLATPKLTFSSPGLIDSQINGAYNFDFSVYEDDDDSYRAGLDTVARRIVETGVTA